MKYSHLSFKNKCGFSLIEVLLSIIIISMICIGSSAYAWHTMKYLKKAEYKMNALNYAEYLTELLLQTESGFLPTLELDEEKYLTLNSTNDWESSSIETYWDVTLESNTYSCIIIAIERDSNDASFVEAEITVTPPEGTDVTLNTFKNL